LTNHLRNANTRLYTLPMISNNSNTNLTSVNHHRILVPGIISSHFVPQEESNTLITNVFTNVQVRYRRKKKIKPMRQLPRPVYNNMWEDPETYTWETKGLERKRKARALRPQYRDILVIRDFKFGVVGQEMRLKAKHAYKFVTKVPPVAVFKNEDTYQKYIIDGIVKEKFNGDLEAFKQDLALRYNNFKVRYLLERIAVKFQRRIDGPGKEYKFPITKKDLIDRIWNMIKIPLREEQIEMPGHFPDRPIKTPGYYVCWVKLDDGIEQKVKLRVYLKGTGSTYQGY